MNKEVLSSDHSPGADCLSSTLDLHLSARDVLQTLSDNASLFFKSLTLGRVRGVVNLILSVPAQSSTDQAYVQLIAELIKRDILVTIAPLRAADLDAPIFSTPEIFEHTGDGLEEFCGFTGITPVLYLFDTPGRFQMSDFYNQIIRQAEIDPAQMPVAELIADGNQEQALGFGTLFTMEDDPEKTADLIDRHIHEKRLAVQWCDRCGGCFSPFS